MNIDTAIILTKRTRDGREAVVRLHEYTPGHNVAHVYLDGKFGGMAGASIPMPLRKPQAELTHYLGGSADGKRPALGLTPAEAQQVAAAIAAADRADR